MRVATYNIRLGIQEGVAACAAVLERSGTPDLVALQEVGDGWTMGPSGHTAAELAGLLGLPHHLHIPALSAPEGGRYGTAILSRAPLDTLEVVALPRRRDEPRRAWVGRVAGLTVVSTHLSHLDDERTPQGEALRDLALSLAAEGGRVLVMGDLNDQPPAAQWLADLLDTFAAAPSPPTFPAHAPTRRIDWLLASPAAGRWETPVTPSDPAAVAASDHLPILAVLRR